MACAKVVTHFRYLFNVLNTVNTNCAEIIKKRIKLIHWKKQTLLTEKIHWLRRTLFGTFIFLRMGFSLFVFNVIPFPCEGYVTACSLEQGSVSCDVVSCCSGSEAKYCGTGGEPCVVC